MKTKVNYYNTDGSVSHTSDNTWSLTKLHCLNCGEKGIYSEAFGDYYAGERHICLKCGYYFSLPGEPDDAKEDVQQKQVLEQLRALKANE